MVALLAVSLLAFLSTATAVAATRAPEVGYLAATHVSTTGATIEVSINPEGGETSYEISLECQRPLASSQNCEPTTGGSPQQLLGVLPADSESDLVTDPVAGLEAGYEYHYGVIATNSAGKEGYLGAGFITCPSQGSCLMQPYMPGESLWVFEGAKKEAEEAPRLEAEREARQREAAERPAKEAAERAAKEREIREAGERAGREAARLAALAHPCVVPRLRGDSPAQAAHALRRAHCSLGRLTEPAGNHGPLVVVRQSAHSGTKLTAGSRVAVALGPVGSRDQG